MVATAAAASTPPSISIFKALEWNKKSLVCARAPSFPFIISHIVFVLTLFFSLSHTSMPSNDDNQSPVESESASICEVLTAHGDNHRGFDYSSFFHRSLHNLHTLVLGPFESRRKHASYHRKVTEGSASAGSDNDQEPCDISLLRSEAVKIEKELLEWNKFLWRCLTVLVFG